MYGKLTEEMEVTQLAGDTAGNLIYSLRQTRGGHVHAFLLVQPDKLMVIDTLYDQDAHLLLNAISGIGRKRTDVQAIILTHAHRSHLGGVRALKIATGAPIYCNELEVPIVQGTKKATRVGRRPMKPYHPTVYGLQIALSFGIGSHQPTQVDEVIKPNQYIGPLVPISTPGHTPGSMSFYWPELKALFVGDVLATWPEVMNEPVYAGWEGFTLDFTEQRRSVNHLKGIKDDVQILCVGHGEPVPSAAGDLIGEVKL
jgi:glyoxylase-like metal-dependent hydrolase (beta-lactamase superfamily II)